MGIRPGERHPARAINKDNNWLGTLLLDSTAYRIPNDPDMPDLEGATHSHVIEGENFVVMVLTHYNEDTETYMLLSVDKSEYGSSDASGLTTVLARGKTREQLDDQNAREVEPSDEHMAQVIAMFKEMNN
jgi:hypothetical protein